jgi:hypothetical protein
MEIDEVERKLLIESFAKLPVEFFSRMRHLQPQIGCLNCCSICSKFASKNSEYWTKEQIDNIVFALKEVGRKYRKNKPYLVWNREEYRPGIVFSYLDNDIGSYPYLDYYLEQVYGELGVKTRISTIGYSRYNTQLNEIHENINKNLLDTLGGVRLSFTPYAIGWQDNELFSKEDYALDMANFLKIYKSYYDYAGSGSRQMCVEIRYKPLCKNAEVTTTDILGHYIIMCDKYLFISKEKNIHFKISQVDDAYDHTISINNKPILFNKYYFKGSIEETDITEIIHSNKGNGDKWLLLKENCKTYMFENKEGVYYTFDPHIEADGCYGMQIYPYNDVRKKSGYLITERYFLNVLFKYNKTIDINNVSWKNVDEILLELEKLADDYLNKGIVEVSKYIKEEILDTLKWYVFALKNAEYSPKAFFSENFTIDTGIICNLGRGFHEFKSITSLINEPLTPTHERNYGNKLSTMTQEGAVWRLSCGFNDEIIIEELELGKTASKQGQIAFYTKINSNIENEKIGYSSIKSECIIPGQRRKVK